MNKILKTLLPVATLGATAACVVPMASCSNKAYLTTSDANFKPTTVAKHAATQIKTQAELDTLLSDYFANPRAFAEDYVYIQTQQTKSAIENYERQKASGAITNYSIDFTISISDYAVEAKEIEYDGEKIKGYRIDATITESGSYSIEMTKEQATALESPYTKIKSSGADVRTIKNCFVTLQKQNWGETVYALEIAEVTPAFNYFVSYKDDVTTEVELLDGTTDVIVNHDYEEESASSKREEYWYSPITPIPAQKFGSSYLSYFEDVTYNIA